VWFSDEAHFDLDGFVNKQNTRFWTSEIPRKVMETLFHSAKYIVWCVIVKQGHITPIFAEQTSGTFNNCKMMSLWSLRKHDMWTQHFSSSIVYARIERMPFVTSCVMCLVGVTYHIDFLSASGVGGPDHHVHRT
jgi:hypothetical protein